MKRVIRNSGLSLLLAIIFLPGTAHAQEKKSEKALLWKISGNGLKEPSYLFGTYHLLGEKFLEEVPETQKPFAQAKGVVVELVFDSTKMISTMMEKAVMKDQKLSTLLSPEDFKRVDSVMLALSGYRLTMFDMFKPVQVSVVITLFQTQKLNAELLDKYKGIPLDVHFAHAGKKSGKTVTALETMEQQCDFLYDHFSVEEQATQLIETIHQHELTAKTSVKMFEWYLEKDIDSLGSMIRSMPENLTGNTDYMLKDRNLNWMKTLPGLMKSGSQFIAVGAGHLPGADGLIELLRKEGYTVTPVTK